MVPIHIDNYFFLQKLDYETSVGCNSIFPVYSCWTVPSYQPMWQKGLPSQMQGRNFISFLIWFIGSQTDFLIDALPFAKQFCIMLDHPQPLLKLSNCPFPQYLQDILEFLKLNTRGPVNFAHALYVDNTAFVSFIFRSFGGQNGTY